MVAGNAPMADTLEYFNVTESEEDYDANTLSGYIIEQLGDALQSIPLRLFRLCRLPKRTAKA